MRTTLNKALTTRKKAASRFLRIAGHVTAERVRPRRPAALPEVPGSVGQLTPAWLTSALCGDHPGAAVTDLEVGEQTEGTASRCPLRVEYNDAGRAAGLPTALFTKSTPHFRSRLLGVAAGEAAFFTMIRPGLDIATPRSYLAAYDPHSGRSMFLLEDLTYTQDVTFGDPRTTHVDRERAQDAVCQLAALHATFWDSPRFGKNLRWVWSTRRFQDNANATIDFEKRSLVGITRAADVSSPEFMRRRAEVWPALMRSLDLQKDAPATLLHQDVHSRNWYQLGAGGMGLHDWQCIARGHWAQDLGYAMTSLLTVEDRRAWERGLLSLYLAELRERGVPAPEVDAAWLAYRQQVFHGLLFWHYTIGAGRMQPAMQPDEISLINIERMTQAVVDLDSLDALDQTR